MTSTTFITGFSRVLNCSKVQVAAAGLVSTWFAVRYATADLPPTQRSALWFAFIGAVAVQLREIINAWTEEDVAAVNAGAQSSGAALPPDASTNQTPPSGPASAAPNSPSSNRSTTMPLRTKLPAVLIGSALLALFAAGCQTPAELVAYREGLRQVDEPLYQAHLLLMDDAVKANLRTDADRQVVKQGIAAAESLYQQSKATQAAGVAATQP
jgi:hypothetical protein